MPEMKPTISQPRTSTRLIVAVLLLVVSAFAAEQCPYHSSDGWNRSYLWFCEGGKVWYQGHWENNYRKIVFEYAMAAKPKLPIPRTLCYPGRKTPLYDEGWLDNSHYRKFYNTYSECKR